MGISIVTSVLYGVSGEPNYILLQCLNSDACGFEIDLTCILVKVISRNASPSVLYMHVARNVP